MKTKSDFAIGQTIKYANGSEAICEGEIVNIKEKSLIGVCCGTITVMVNVHRRV